MPPYQILAPHRTTQTYPGNIKTWSRWSLPNFQIQGHRGRGAQPAWLAMSSLLATLLSTRMLPRAPPVFCCFLLLQLIMIGEREGIVLCGLALRTFVAIEVERKSAVALASKAAPIPAPSRPGAQRARRWGHFITIDTGELQSIAGIVTQGLGRNTNQWVTPSSWR
jgi:hypothetical protein